RLEVRAVPHAAFQAGGLERGGDVVGGLVDAGGARSAALARVGGEEGQVGPQSGDGRLAVERGGEGGEEDEGEKGQDAFCHMLHCNRFAGPRVFERAARAARSKTRGPARRLLNLTPSPARRTCAAGWRW